MPEGFQICQSGPARQLSREEHGTSPGVGPGLHPCISRLTVGNALQLDIMKKLDHPNIAAWLFKECNIGTLIGVRYTEPPKYYWKLLRLL